MAGYTSITNHLTGFNVPVYQPGLTDGVAMLLPNRVERDAIKYELRVHDTLLPLEPLRKITRSRSTTCIYHNTRAFMVDYSKVYLAASDIHISYSLYYKLLRASEWLLNIR